VFISGTQPAIECRLHSGMITQYADRVIEMAMPVTQVTTGQRTVAPATGANPAASSQTSAK
jgi:hypothetical protein